MEAVLTLGFGIRRPLDKFRDLLPVESGPVHLLSHEDTNAPIICGTTDKATLTQWAQGIDVQKQCTCGATRCIWQLWDSFVLDFGLAVVHLKPLPNVLKV